MTTMPRAFKVAAESCTTEYSMLLIGDRDATSAVLVLVSVQVLGMTSRTARRNKPSPSSTQRVLSEFELAAAALDAPMQRRCGHCRRVEHNARRCGSATRGTTGPGL